MSKRLTDAKAEIARLRAALESISRLEETDAARAIEIALAGKCDTEEHGVLFHWAVSIARETLASVEITESKSLFAAATTPPKEP